MLFSREVLKKVHFLAKSFSHLFRTDGRGKYSEVMEFEGKKILYKLSQSVGCHRSAIFVITDMHPLYQELSIRADVDEVSISLFIKAVKNHREISRV